MHRHLVAALCVICALAGCAGEAGGASCGRVTMPTGPGVAAPEVRGVVSAGDAWMLSIDGYPVPSGRPVRVALRLSGAVADDISIRAVPKEFGPLGLTEDVGRDSLPETAGWQRPGKEWTAIVTIPQEGCYLLGFVTGVVQGSFTVRVA